MDGSGDKATCVDQSTTKDAQINSASQGSPGQIEVVNGIGGESLEDEEDTWEWFNILRTMCDTPKRIGVCLELSTDLVAETR